MRCHIVCFGLLILLSVKIEAKSVGRLRHTSAVVFQPPLPITPVTAAPTLNPRSSFGSDHPSIEDDDTFYDDDYWDVLDFDDNVGGMQDDGDGEQNEGEQMGDGDRALLEALRRRYQGDPRLSSAAAAAVAAGQVPQLHTFDAVEDLGKAPNPVDGETQVDERKRPRVRRQHPSLGSKTSSENEMGSVTSVDDYHDSAMALNPTPVPASVLIRARHATAPVPFPVPAPATAPASALVTASIERSISEPSSVSIDVPRPKLVPAPKSVFDTQPCPEAEPLTSIELAEPLPPSKLLPDTESLSIPESQSFIKPHVAKRQSDTKSQPIVESPSLTDLNYNAPDSAFNDISHSDHHVQIPENPYVTTTQSVPSPEPIPAPAYDISISHAVETIQETEVNSEENDHEEIESLASKDSSVGDEEAPSEAVHTERRPPELTQEHVDALFLLLSNFLHSQSRVPAATYVASPVHTTYAVAPPAAPDDVVYSYIPAATIATPHIIYDDNYDPSDAIRALRAVDSNVKINQPRNLASVPITVASKATRETQDFLAKKSPAMYVSSRTPLLLEAARPAAAVATAGSVKDTKETELERAMRRQSTIEKLIQAVKIAGHVEAYVNNRARTAVRSLAKVYDI